MKYKERGKGREKLKVCQTVESIKNVEVYRADKLFFSVSRI